jgi:hypothetical protein
MNPLASSPAVSRHSRPLGVCWLIYGLFRVATAIWLAAFTATATVMFGALLARVPEPFALMADFHLLYLVVLIWAGISGLLGLLAGIAMLTGHGAGGALVRLAAYLCVGDAPLGTTLGVYTLTVLRPTVPSEAALRAQRAA